MCDDPKTRHASFCYYFYYYGSIRRYTDLLSKRTLRSLSKLITCRMYAGENAVRTVDNITSVHDDRLLRH